MADLNLPYPGETAWANKLNNAILSLQSEMESLHGGQQAAINNLSSLLAAIRNVTDPTFQQALQDLLDPIIEDIAADIIASSPTVEAAAAAAVDDALSDTLALAKCLHRASGRWVWDGPGAPGATHYIFYVDGRWRTAATPFPVPSASAPVIAWA